MAQFLVLRINRENSPIKLPDGGSVPALVVTFNPILEAGSKYRVWVDAEEAEDALKIAKEIYPNFSLHLAVQERYSYDHPPANEPVRVFRATKARSD